MSNIERPTSPPRAWVIANVVAAALSALVLTTVAAVLWLVGRRFAGALSPPSPRTLVTVAITVVGGAALVRLGGLQLRRTTSWYARWARLEQYLLTASVSLTGLTLTFVDAPSVALALLWSAVVGEEVWWWSWQSAQGRSTTPTPNEFRAFRTSAGAELPTPPSSTAIPVSSVVGEAAPTCEPEDAPTNQEASDSDAEEQAENDEAESASAEPILPADVDQQVTRHGGNGGEAWLEGIYRVRFAAGDRNSELHLSFCPPWDVVPKLEVQVLAGVPAQCRVTQVETFGGRLELRRSGPVDQTDETIVYLLARPTAQAPVAAANSTATRSPLSN